MSTVPSVTLNNGVRMPAIGLGCWAGETLEEQVQSQTWFLTALKNGYRHLDTAHGYDTEQYVGNAIRESGIPRKEVFVTTKLPFDHHARVAASLEESLERAGLDYFDLYLMHWPQAFRYRADGSQPPDDESELDDETTFSMTWADMEKLMGTGKVRAIGVSNFSIKKDPAERRKHRPGRQPGRALPFAGTGRPRQVLLGQGYHVDRVFAHWLCAGSRASRGGHGCQEAQCISRPDCPCLACSTRLYGMP